MLKMVGSKFILPIFLFLLCYTLGQPRVDPLVTTREGLIRGLPAADGDYSMFLGIPYATVNSSNPFGQSIPQTEFEDIFDAFDDSKMCPQVEYFSNTVQGTLDCLRLNVYVPSTANSNNRLPVLVWFHGGAYSTGFAGRYFYGPKFLVKHEVILVTVNYRLGPYGFFCLNTPEVPGNQGLKDQLTALRWVKNNIDAFGGDSIKITIFGESAGGSSVNHHLIFGKEDLFSKVIIQSASNLSPNALTESDNNAPLKLAEYLNYESNNLDSVLNFLATVDPASVISATADLSLVLRPCVEKEFDNIESLITDYPINVIADKVKNVPILIGYTDNEALYSFWNSPIKAFDNIFSNNLNESFDFESDRLTRMAKKLRQFYIGDEDINEDLRQQLIDFSSDFRYIYPIHRTIQSYVEEGANLLYHYSFSYDGDRNLFKSRYNITTVGAAHTDELSYLFDMGIMDDPVTPSDQLVIGRITTLWTNFAKYGNPTPATNDLLPILWPAVTKEALYCMDIGSDLRMTKRPFHERMTFWDIFYELNEEFQQGYKNSERINFL